MSEEIKPRKVVIVGAGRVGSHSALCLMFQHLVNEIVFVDINQEAAAAQAGDLNDLASGLGDNFVIRVGNYSDCVDAHFVVLTAGRSRRPGETRLEMLDGTLKILEGIVTGIRESGFHGIFISVSNPCDVVTEYLYRNLGLPRSQVFGTGTLLDSARLRRALSEIIGVNSKQIQAICMGEHGDSSFIPTSHISVQGIDLREYLSLVHSDADINFDDVMKRVRESGSSIVAGKGCTEFGIGSVVASIIASILHNESIVLPLSAHLDGEYGESGISIGVPCMLGMEGIERVLEIDLSYNERRAMRKSCDVVRSYVDQAMLPVEEQAE
ncbi:L-lactate dehydrogenase [Paratractidigestivibacter sp.]|uniref:L-lactate dehydrogenase n=1 Tax=Paratractidigestivibacter sp. TaxID=2847316 RepID=UPI002ABDFDC8|nr:L-lactate dehydrogenase [Paratractidigestivibacter sp.]